MMSWRLIDLDDVFIIADENNESVAVIAGREQRDKARLIRTAPELLSTLGRLLFDCEAHGLTDHDAHLREARLIIRKAKGEFDVE